MPRLGRGRRKKCDEVTPQCGSCIRMGLACSWPSGVDTDRRTRRYHRFNRDTGLPQECHFTPGLSVLQLPAPITMPSPFQRDQHRYLYLYFCSAILPRLIRQNSLARYADQTYMLRLALEYPPLMGALISIAGMQISPPSRWSVSHAVESYIQTIQSLQNDIGNRSEVIYDDGLLATVVTLAVFEV